jgi:hypothetical protein
MKALKGKHNLQLAACTLAASLMTFLACGGGQKIGSMGGLGSMLPPVMTGSSPKHITMVQTSGGGTHTSVVSRVVTFAAIFFQASGGETQYAETYEGFCATMPTADPSDGTTLVLNNAGVIGNDDCAAQFFNDAIPGQEPIVTGAGTLQHLIVTALPDGATDVSGVAKVYVNGTDSGITCTVGNTTRCVSADAQTATVADGDKISIKFFEAPGTHYRYVRARVAKA